MNLQEAYKLPYNMTPRKRQDYCCFGYYHITTLAVIIAVLSIADGAIRTAENIRSTNYDEEVLEKCVNLTLIFSGVVALLAIWKEKALLLLPLIVATILQTLCTVRRIHSLDKEITETLSQFKVSESLASKFTVILCCVSLTAAATFLVVLWKCFLNLKRREQEKPVIGEMGSVWNLS
uniref:Uncharacterized protein n=1 Tax=Steinernema glaseri TaxID=37863 RepID=A0A1I7Y9Y4_9BILA